MRRSTMATIRHVILRLLALTLLASFAAGAAYAESPLTPDDLSYENGNIVLHKNAERIGPDEWRVTVKATVGEVPVEKRKLEVVFVLDSSGSMAWCTDEEAHNAGNHTHSGSCRLVSTCGKEEHTHTLEECYEYDCGYAQEHTHTDACYQYTCTTEEHSHTVADGCYKECTRAENSDHYAQWFLGWYHKTSGTTCTRINGSYYELICEKQEHSHDASCPRVLTCTIPPHTHGDECIGDISCDKEEHTHSDQCAVYSCGKVECRHITSGNNRCYYKDADGNTVYYPTRMEAAINAVKKISSGLGSEVDITYVDFDSSTRVVTSLDSVEAEGGTNLSSGVRTGINQFTGGADRTEGITKVLIVVADGDSNDGYNPSNLGTFKNNGGIVYAVGFNNNDSNLAGFTGNGGTYMHATNSDELRISMDKIENALTAMLEDPMGTTVGFEKTSIQTIQTSGGVISSTEDTIYWHPAEDGSDTVRNSTIEYSYTVKLNEQADMSGGTHSNVPLNNPTNFLYGIEDSSGVTNMNAAAFPIPKAEYAIGSLQTKWQANGQDIQDPTEVESIICDYASATYIPAYTQDYQTITPVIPISGSNDYYRYIGTTVTADGKQLSGVEAVDATEPVAYVVIHQYERVESNELAVGGTKALIGRDFKTGDRFTFTLTAVTPGAPMPEQAQVTIEPESGSSMAFSFGSISYNTAGTYTYTIQEQQGNLDKVIYDLTQHTLVVTAEEVNNEIIVSYTLDGVANGHLTVTNRLETGSLLVEKRTVTSHLPEHQEKVFDFLVNVKDSSNRPLNGEYELIPGSGASRRVTFTNGFAAISLKAGESVVISGLPNGASYTVTEDAAGGFTVTSEGSTGTIAADRQSNAFFDNTYQSSGLYQFIGTKKLDGAVLARDQFSFSVLDEAGNVVARGKNNADGSFFLDTMYFTQEDLGPKRYTIREDAGTDPSYIYDRTTYDVTLTITDNGDGTLKVEDDLNGTPIVFVNKHISHQLVVSKMVAGNIGSTTKAFNFTLSVPDMAGETVSVSTDGGTTFTDLTLDSQGQTTFTLQHDQSIFFYPISGAYTVTETDAENYAVSCKVDQGAAADSTVASGSVDEDGSHVAFVNTLEASPPTGVRTSSASALAGFCLAAGLIAIQLAGRRFARREE